ncbi:YciE/YciF ferroxidase family protein [Pelagibacterium xiamenense]|uniref:YciE/YciF ferroxidase family protein n=1 Tax=Pelagibacterium xiamenense TaxID=2901140 RepID=UPI001E423993|nr:ferritin-like domain-containing protein [Pelagibacterium xiamenense]MCD7058294.1 ferritin-like domain-containing protein [Pelagibacterium xiamenense]
MALKSLNDLFIHTLKDIYFAENLLVKELPKMAEKSSSADLKSAFESHLEETREHVDRLEQVFEILGEKAEAEECPAIEGITKEAHELLDEIDDAETRDAALISSAQAAEHYEITRYGTLATWAKELGHDDVADLLHKTLDEEKSADEKLLKLAKDSLNLKAA